jgi:outer membrane protein
MKNPVRILFAVALLSSAGLVAQAQSALKIVVVDMAKLYDTHFKTEETNAKLRSDEQKAQEELDKLNKEGNALVEQYKEYLDQVNNPASTAEAKQKAQESAQAKYEEINKKRQEVQSFQMNTTKFLQQRINNFKTVMLEDISKVATEIAKKKGASMLIDKSGPSLIGVSPFLYVDASFDITEEVQAEVNKGRPAVSPTAVPAPAAPAATTPAAPAAFGEPAITVPGAKK